MRHFLLLIFYALVVSVVFGTTGRDSTRDKLTYGAKIFIEFICIGLALGWLLYWLPI